MKTITLPTKTPLLFFLFLIVSWSTQSQIIINEIHADPATGIEGDANGDGTRDAIQDEFVELYNPSANDIDITGWNISDEFGLRHSFSNVTTIPSQGTIVIFGGGNPTGDFGDSKIRTASSGQLGFSNAGDSVILKNDSDATVASYQYSNEASDNQSITRSPDVTGDFVKHLTTGNLRFSPGTKTDGSNFPGNTGNDDDDPINALKVVTWNVEWFGNSGNGPSPVSTQKDRVKSILQTIDADIYALQEISNGNLMNELVDELPDYEWKSSPYISGSGISAQKVAFIYRISTISNVSFEGLLIDLSPKYNGGDTSGISDYPTSPSEFWSSGRMPYMLSATATIDGFSEDIKVINIHAKAGSNNGPIRRAYDVEKLKEFIDTDLANENIIFLGDYNDDTEDGNSSYDDYIFDTVTSPGNDSNYYEIVTRPLDLAGENTFVGGNRFIDHITITDELTDNFVEGSVKVHKEFVGSDYTDTTSDHIPVSAKFTFDATLGTDDVGLPNTLSLKDQVLVYPNPTNGPINVMIKSSKYDDLSYFIYDIKRALISEGKIETGKKQQLNTKLNSAGVYTLKIISNKEVVVKKIVRY